MTNSEYSHACMAALPQIACGQIIGCVGVYVYTVHRCLVAGGGHLHSTVESPIVDTLKQGQSLYKGHI